MKSTGFFQFLDKNISINDQKDLFESIKLDPIIWTSFTNLPLIKKIAVYIKVMICFYLELLAYIRGSY